MRMPAFVSFSRSLTGATPKHVLSRRAYFGVLGGAVLGMGMFLFPFEASAASSAEGFIQTVIARGNAILGDSSLDAGQRDQRFREFLLSITDMKRTAMFTLGSYAQSTPEPQVADFLATFTDFDIAIYQRGFGSYGQTIRVMGSTERSPDDVIVNTEAADPKGKPEPFKIAFRVRRNDAGQDIITDIQVEGVWLAISQRSGFVSYLDLHGGDVAKLSHELKSRTAS